MPEAVIREFTERDRAVVEEFFAQMGGETRAFFNREDGNYHTAMDFFGEKKKDNVYFLMEEDGTMIGYVFLYESTHTVPWLGIAVREGYKGQGIGRKLIAHAQAYAVAHGKAGLLLTTHVANVRGQALYVRMGFVHMGLHHSGELLYLWMAN